MPVLLLLCLLLPGALPAQSVPLVLDAGTKVKTIEVERSRGNAVFSLNALEPLGATVETDARTARLKLYGATFNFQYTSPFFTVGNKVHQLVAPPRKSTRGVLVSTQFFTEILPAQFRDRLTYSGGVVKVKNAARRDTAKAAPRQTTTPRKPDASVKARPAPPNVSATRVVIIDAGHGGKDPGARGLNGLREKNVTLAVSLKLAALLKDRGFEVHLTRTRDTLIALSDRPHFANEWKKNRPATLFVSIHANWGVKGMEGYETYFLSEARTDDE